MNDSKLVLAYIDNNHSKNEGETHELSPKHINVKIESKN